MREPPLLIATTPPTAAQLRAAAGVAATLFVVFLCALPFAGVALPRSDAVVPAVSMIMFIGDCVSAVLLFGQFAVLRTRAMLMLAAGYLFTAVLVVAYALTFPGPFSPTGMLGAGLQTAGWIFVMWHIGLPIAAIAYVVLGGASPDAATTRAGVLTSIAVSVAVAGAITFFTIEYHDVLPALTSDPVRMVDNKAVRAVMVAICAAAVIVLARQRRSVLDLWLLVVLFAWLLDALLTSVTENRYTVAWYANRVIRVVAANIVLFVLLTESVQLYARLALSILAQRREREGRMMTMEAMAAALEHEIRQPLTAIRANAAAARRLLDRSPPDLAETRAAVVDIEADAARTTHTLQSVRDIFAQREAAHERVDINSLVKETVALARPSLASDIGVELQLAERPPIVTANRSQLQEVLLNLVNNAAESMRGVTDHATVLKISTAAVEPGRVEIAMADTGAGIDERNLERIFEPFFTTKASGLGMGLAICRSIVERHGGTLSASCGEPYGAVFRVQFPGGE